MHLVPHLLGAELGLRASDAYPWLKAFPLQESHWAVADPGMLPHTMCKLNNLAWPLSTNPLRGGKPRPVGVLMSKSTAFALAAFDAQPKPKVCGNA